LFIELSNKLALGFYRLSAGPALPGRNTGHQTLYPSIGRPGFLIDRHNGNLCGFCRGRTMMQEPKNNFSFNV
jgi:hypothetical protein